MCRIKPVSRLMNFAATIVAIGLCIGFAVDGRAQSTLAATNGSVTQRRPGWTKILALTIESACSCGK